MKIIKYIILGSLLLLVLAAAAGFWYFKHTAPDYSGTVSSNVVTEGAEVTFDSLGIPHILAKNSGDAYFALGYIHASERLFQMELLRRVGSGRLAEILGKDLVSVDKFFRSLGIRNTAKAAAASWQQSNAPWIPLSKKYLEGINHFIDTQPLPAEFTLLGIEKQHFTAEDIYLIAGYMAFSFAEALKTDPVLSKIALIENGAYLPFTRTDSTTTETAATASMLSFQTDQIFELLPVSPWTGSNAWVISGNKSKSGKPILANDTHIGYQQPAVWYEAELKCPDHHIYGHYLAGIPFPLTGHTPEHAWGLTMFENDDLNLYTEEVKDNRYRNGNDWYDISVTTDTIQVKDTLPEVFKIKSTHRGPLVSSLVPHLPDSARQEYSLWWSYTKLPANAPDVLFQFVNSKTLAQARQAAATVNAPGLNIIYANRSGDIACWSAGKIPVYSRNTDTRFILTGETGKDDPVGFLDFSQNPQTENPASGIIISANQAPDKLIGDSLPVYGYYAPDDRYHRLAKLLEADKKWNIHDFKALQNDVTSDEQASLAKFVFEQIQNETYGDIINLVKSWKGEHHIEDTAPSVWYTTLSFILKNTMEDELDPFDYSVYVNTHMSKTYMGSMIRNKDSKWWNNIHTEATETRDQIFTESFVEAVQFLQSQFGNDPGSWQWGKLHTLTHNHPAGAVKPLNLIFNIGPMPAPGGIETINNASFAFTAGEPFKIKYGAAMRNIIDLADPTSALSILPTGQSGHTGSNHYDDQSLSYVTGVYRPMLMRPAFDPGSSEKTILFTPGN